MLTTSMAASKENKNLSDPLGLFSLLSLDLVLEILYKLPVLSLLTLKCVSKPLNSFISDPKFAKDHLRLSRTCHYHLLLYDSRLPFVLNNSTCSISGMKLNFPLNSCENGARIIDSCDGIICFKILYHKDIVVWNPCVEKFKILPPLENLPSISTKTTYSIGYDQFTDSYKVVAVSCYQFNKSFKTQVRVHNLGTDFWRRNEDFPSQILGKPQGKGKFVRNTINWGIKNQENDSSWVILSLDLGNESYQEILQPDYRLGEPVQKFRLGVSRDYLCVLAHTETILDIWVMKDYGNKDSWTKLSSLPFTEFFDYYGYARLLYISEEDDLVFLDFYRMIYVYNYKHDMVKNIHKFRDLPYTPFTSNVYVESLISP